MEFDICATASGGLGLTYDFMFFDWDAVADVLERNLGVSLAQFVTARRKEGLSVRKRAELS